MENKEFAKYHTWCDVRGIRVYPIPQGNSVEFKLAVERNGSASIGNQIFYDNPVGDQRCVWKQVGVLLKAIVYKELDLMEIKSTFNQLEGICEAAIKSDRVGVTTFLEQGVPFREAILYLEGFFPEHKDKGELIYQLAHCKCGNPILFKPGKSKKECSSCGFTKSMQKIEYSKS
jgi:hypothetical protein